MNGPLSDAELIGRSLAGQEMAFVALIERHQTGVWSYLVRRVGRGPAEDLLGEVWVSAFAARHRYDQRFIDARPWLFGIARNTLRRHWRDPSAVGDHQLADQTALATDPWPAVDQRLDGATLLRQALERIRPEEREVLLLVVWEELTVAGAARTLGLPAGTARRRLHQARMALREDANVTRWLREGDAVEEAR